ncbi:MAG: hypothetical protein KGJ84_12445 [Elusimicrobia bacterium]|nr:hypothetical protein [Elusimicrobiota bacterium]
MRLVRLLITLCLGALLSVSAAAHEGHHGHQAAETMPAMSGHVQAAPRPAVGELALLRMHLTEPEYWHVLIHPFPIFGMAIGAALLMFALIVKSREARAAGLTLIVLASLGAFATVKIGQKAYDRVYDGLENESQQWLDVHMERAENSQWAFYLTGLLALVLVVAGRGKGWERGATFMTLAGALLCSALGGWIAHAGGQVRHSEFRLGPPAAPVDHEGKRHEN